MRLVDNVVTQVARLVSIGQLPSGRTDAVRNSTPRLHDRVMRSARRRRGWRRRNWSAAWLPKSRRRRAEFRSSTFSVRPARQPPQQAGRRISRRQAVMPQLADGDQRRQRVADHRHPQPAKPFSRAGGQLERKLRHQPPRFAARAQCAGHRQHGQNRHRKCPILAVAANNRGRQLLRFESAGGAEPATSESRVPTGASSASSTAGRSAMESVAQQSAVVLMLLRLSTVSPHPPSAFCVWTNQSRPRRSSSSRALRASPGRRRAKWCDAFARQTWRWRSPVRCGQLAVPMPGPLRQASSRLRGRRSSVSCNAPTDSSSASCLSKLKWPRASRP